MFLSLLLAVIGAAQGHSDAAAQVLAVEVVATDAAVGDGGNAWGGHQCRIVRTRDGLFTAYTVAGQDPLHRQWRLAERTDHGWIVAASGPSGREPVNLLAGPHGELYVVAWPEGIPTLWTSQGKPAAQSSRHSAGGALSMERSMVPGDWGGPTNWPYAAAGIDASGDLCVLQSAGEKPGLFHWAYRTPDGRWQFHTTPLDYRFCYAYVIPSPGQGLTVVATRDVLWKSLGYEQPAGAFSYVFNAAGFWSSPDADRQPLQSLLIGEAPPTAATPIPLFNAQLDAYVDTHGRTHVLYTLRNEAAGGRDVVHHALIEQGRVARDVSLPGAGGSFWRIIQDTGGRFYLIGSNGLLYPTSDADGMALEDPVHLDLGGHAIEYSGLALAAPRGGTRLGDTIDAVFPSHDGSDWIYCQIRLR